MSVSPRAKPRGLEGEDFWVLIVIGRGRHGRAFGGTVREVWGLGVLRSDSGALFSRGCIGVEWIMRLAASGVFGILTWSRHEAIGKRVWLGHSAGGGSIWAGMRGGSGGEGGSRIAEAGGVGAAAGLRLSVR